MLKTISIAAIIAATTATSSFAGAVSNADVEREPDKGVFVAPGSSLKPEYLLIPAVICLLACKELLKDDDDSGSSTPATPRED